MDGRAFDGFVRGLTVSDRGRRGFLRLLGSGLVAAGATAVQSGAPSRAACSDAGERCRRDNDCCTRSCSKNRCARAITPSVSPTPDESPSEQSVDDARVTIASNRVVVSATKVGWTRAPVEVQRKDLYVVRYVSGRWTVDFRDLPYVGPNGYSPGRDRQIWQGCKPFRAFPYARLLGRVGNNGVVLSIGDGGLFTSDDVGPVWLTINDGDNCLADNQGSVQVVVEKVIAPMRGKFRVIGPDPGEGNHKNSDRWAVDFTSDNLAVYPVASGRVVFAAYNCDTDGASCCYGNTVVIHHGNGYYSIYAHLAESNPRLRDKWVTPASKIGTMSNSGCPGSVKHVHFVIRQGKPGLSGRDALLWGKNSIRTRWT